MKSWQRVLCTLCAACAHVQGAVHDVHAASSAAASTLPHRDAPRGGEAQLRQHACMHTYAGGHGGVYGPRQWCVVRHCRACAPAWPMTPCRGVDWSKSHLMCPLATMLSLHSTRHTAHATQTSMQVSSFQEQVPPTPRAQALAHWCLWQENQQGHTAVSACHTPRGHGAGTLRGAQGE